MFGFARRSLIQAGCFVFAGVAVAGIACSRKAHTRHAIAPLPAHPATVIVPQLPPSPPALPGLRIDVYAEPILGGQYSLLSVGPLRPQPVEAMKGDGVPPLLLVHGLGQFGMADYYPVLEALAQDRRVLAFDLPGFGQSTRGNREYRPAAFAQFVAHVVDIHAAGKADVLGHSMGGAVSIAFAGRHPTKVRRLILVDVAGVLFRETLIYEMENEFSHEPEADLIKLVGRDLWRAALSLASPFAFDPDLVVWESTLLDGVGHNPMSQAPDRLVARVLPFVDAPQLGPLANKRPGVTPVQQGGCTGRSVHSFEGRWSRLEISGCRQVLIQNAVVESLVAHRSNVELRQVTVEQGTYISEGSLRATGSLLLGETALDINSSNVDLAGVEVVGTGKSIAVAGKSTLIGSVTGVATNAERSVVHGRVRLEPGMEW